MTTLRARVPTRGGSRRAHLREWRRESLWLWPAVAAIAAWVAGDIATRHLHGFTFHQGLFPTNLDDARTLLATIAAALLTFTGVVFSITLVALQMSSTQYSPPRAAHVRPQAGDQARPVDVHRDLRLLVDLAGAGRDHDEGPHRAPGCGWVVLPAGHGLGARVRRLRALDGAFHAGQLCDSGGLQRDAARDARHVRAGGDVPRGP